MIEDLVMVGVGLSGRPGVAGTAVVVGTVVAATVLVLLDGLAYRN